MEWTLKRSKKTGNNFIPGIKSNQPPYTFFLTGSMNQKTYLFSHLGEELNHRELEILQLISQSSPTKIFLKKYLFH